MSDGAIGRVILISNVVIQMACIAVACLVWQLSLGWGIVAALLSGVLSSVLERIAANAIIRKFRKDDDER